MAALNQIAVHAQNQTLAETIVVVAGKQNLNVPRNVTSINSKDGYYRYVVLRLTSNSSIAINSKSCLNYTEARFSKWHNPSIIGEQRALLDLPHRLTD